MTEIKNFNELTEQVLDKQDTLLSSKEIAQLNQIKPVDYARMKDQISIHQIDWNGRSYALKDFVRKINQDGTVDGEKIKWGSELGAWVQIFLISQEYDTNKQNQKYLGIDGKVGRFTWKSLSAFKGDANTLEKAKEYTKDQIDQQQLKRINQWLQGGREFSDKWKNPIKVNILDEKNPFVVSVENYGMHTIIDLNTGKMVFDGLSFDWFSAEEMEKVNGGVNIEATSKNTRLLSSLFKQANLINKTFSLIQTKAGSDAPFYVNNVIGGGGLTAGGGVVFDVAGFNLNRTIVSHDALYKDGGYSTERGKDWLSYGLKPGDSQKIADIFNKIYQKRVKEGKIS